MSGVSVAPGSGRLAQGAAARATPMRLLALFLAVAAAVMGGVIFYSISQPWLGVHLRYDAKAGGAVVLSSDGPSRAIPRGTVITHVSGGGDRLRIGPKDLTGQVDGSFGPFAEYQDFMARQGRYAAMQRSPSLTFTDKTGRDWTIQPQPPTRPITSFGPDFWIGILVGTVSWLICAAIFAFKPGETSARYILLSGISCLLFIPIGPIYTSRELGLPEFDFYLINGMNAFGGTIYAAVLPCILLYYPRKIAPRWVGWSVLAVTLAWYVAQAMGLFPSLTFARRIPALAGVGVAFLLSGVQWVGTARDPVARAALGWFLLSWVVTVTGFVMLILAPQMFGVDTGPAEPYGFLLFLVTFVGLAVGVMRYRLFELGPWWARIVVWTLGLFLLAGLDMLFLAALHLSSGLSLSLSLLMCGLVWLPLRGWVTDRVLRRRRTDDRALFESVVQIGLTSSASAQLAQWTDALRACFDPLSVDLADPVPDTRLEADGLALVTPAFHGLPSLRMEYARGGRALFSPEDVAQARALADMLRFVFDNRDAYERGVTVERKRIAGDLHDNLGAGLLSALHSRDGERKDRYIRETLSDLRSIVSDPVAEGAGLIETLAASRKEMSERLAARGVRFDWSFDELPDEADVDSKITQSLRAMLREITNNIIKHAQAATVQVALVRAADALVLTVRDDGVGFDPAAVTPGAGLGGLNARAAAHGGSVAFQRGKDGRGMLTTVRLPTG